MADHRYGVTGDRHKRTTLQILWAWQIGLRSSTPR